jgi:hypothetical protein
MYYKEQASGRELNALPATDCDPMLHQALYWTTNLNSDPGRFFIFLLEYTLTVLMMMHYSLALGYASQPPACHDASLSLSRSLSLLCACDCTDLSIYLMVSSAMPTEEAAMGLSSIFFSIFILFNGFFILTNSIRDWWIWANWVSPLKYVFYVGINNEFRGVEFDCAHSNSTDCGYKTGDELLSFYGADNGDLIVCRNARALSVS